MTVNNENDEEWIEFWLSCASKEFAGTGGLVPKAILRITRDLKTGQDLEKPQNLMLACDRSVDFSDARQKEGFSREIAKASFLGRATAVLFMSECWLLGGLSHEEYARVRGKDITEHPNRIETVLATFSSSRTAKTRSFCANISVEDTGKTLGEFMEAPAEGHTTGRFSGFVPPRN